jgi:hypothetical protein
MTSANGIENEAADIASLLDANQLDYRLAPSLSIATSRSMRSYAALQNTYTLGDKITFVPSTGATYADLLNSYIAFDLVFINNTPAGSSAYVPIDGARIPGYCGYGQLFSDYALTHASGVEMDRQTQAVGEWVQIEQYYNMSHQKRLIQGSTYLHNDTPQPVSPLIDTGMAYEEACKAKWWLPDMIGTTAKYTPSAFNTNQLDTQSVFAVETKGGDPTEIDVQTTSGVSGAATGSPPVNPAPNYFTKPLVVSGTQADFGAGLAISRTFGPRADLTGEGDTYEPQWKGLLPINQNHLVATGVNTPVNTQNGIRDDPIGLTGPAIDIIAPFPTADESWRQKYARVAQPTRNGIGVITASGVGAAYVSGWQSGFKEDQDLSGQRVRVVIPLTHLIPMFRNNLLAPSYLIAGLRIELGTYAKETFFQSVTVLNKAGFDQDYVPFTWNPLHSVQIQNPVINFETFTLTDAITRKIAQISAASGLEWSWDAIHQSFTTTSSTDFSYSINRNISRANIVVVKTRSVNNLTAQSENYFASDAWDSPLPLPRITFPMTYPQNPLANDRKPSSGDQAYDGTMASFQVQLGALYIPAQPIVNTTEFLHSALKTFCQYRRNDEVGGVPLFQFRGQAYSIAPADNDLIDAIARDSTPPGSTPPPVYYTRTLTSIPDNFSRTLPSLAIACVPLESSSTLQQSGAAISPARTAIVNMRWLYPRNTDQARRIDLFVSYTKLATLLLDSCVIRS